MLAEVTGTTPEMDFVNIFGRKFTRQEKDFFHGVKLEGQSNLHAKYMSWT
jgi:hypothetical protein